MTARYHHAWSALEGEIRETLVQIIEGGCDSGFRASVLMQAIGEAVDASIEMRLAEARAADSQQDSAAAQDGAAAPMAPSPG